MIEVGHFDAETLGEEIAWLIDNDFAKVNRLEAPLRNVARVSPLRAAQVVRAVEGVLAHLGTRSRGVHALLEVAVSFHQRGRPILGRPARLGSDAVKAVCQRRAQIAGDQAVRLGASNSDQLGPIRHGAGPRPALRNTVAIVVAETLIPSPFSSPWMRI